MLARQEHKGSSELHRSTAKESDGSAIVL